MISTVVLIKNIQVGVHIKIAVIIQLRNFTQKKIINSLPPVPVVIMINRKYQSIIIQIKNIRIHITGVNIQQTLIIKKSIKVILIEVINTE